MKKYKKVIAISLSSVMISSCFSNVVFANQPSLITNAYEENNIDKNSKTNFEIDLEDIYNINYTYEEYGREFKVIEHANEDFTIIDSKIYEKNENINDYVLISEFTTTLSQSSDKSELEVIKNENGNILKDIIPSEESLLISNTEPQRSVRAFYRNEWVHVGSYSGSTKVSNYTLTVAVAVVFGALGFVATGPASAGVISGVSAVAGIIVTEAIPIVYYTKDVNMYYDNYGYQYKNGVYGDFYEDSSRRQYIGSSYVEGIIDEGSIRG